jgi:glycosyltransferase involved in cell wall biosynthesis
VRTEYGWSDDFVFLYAGAHGHTHNLHKLLDLAQVLTDYPRIRIVLMGDGMAKPELKLRAEREGLKNLQFVDAQPREKMRDFYNAADVCIAILKKLECFTTVHPGKLFDCMSCGRPILVAIDGLARKLVEDGGAGVYADPDDLQGLKDAVLLFYNNPSFGPACGARGYEYIVTHYARKPFALALLRELHACGKGGGIY